MLSMTATEVRDRLDDRFRLLVGSRRGIERHQTLRHAVQWSYDLLDDDEKSLLTTCSVFAGGFDLAGAAPSPESDDEFATLDLLDALVRKSLLVADRSSGRTRFSMLETIRQFAEEQLAPRTSRRVRDRTRPLLRRLRSRRPRPVGWSSAARSIPLAHRRNWRIYAPLSMGRRPRDLDTAAAIAIYAAFLGMWIEQYEPVAWAEELIGPAGAVEHPRLAQLYMLAAQCYSAGRIDQSARVFRGRPGSDRQRAIRRGARQQPSLARRAPHPHRRASAGSSGASR